VRSGGLQLVRLSPFLRVSCALSDLGMPPSEETLSAIRANLAGRRRDQSRIRLFQGVAAFLAALLVVVALLGISREHERVRAEARRLVVEARSSLTSPPATQVAVLQARAATSLEDTVETREVAAEVVDRLAAPSVVFRTSHLDKIAVFGAMPSQETLVIDTLASAYVLSTDKTGSSSTRRAPLLAPGCRQSSFSSNGRRVACTRSGEAIVQDTISGQIVRTFSSPSLVGELRYALDDVGKYLAISTTDQMILVEVDSGRD
jgi:hypothetical protein